MSNLYTDELQNLSPAPADPGAAAQSNFQKVFRRLWGRLNVPYAASIALDFRDETTRIVGTLTANLTLTTVAASLAGGRSMTVVLTADATARTLTLPAWIPQGGALPTTLAASKQGTLILCCDGTTDASIRAFWQVQP